MSDNIPENFKNEDLGNVIVRILKGLTTNQANEVVSYVKHHIHQNSIVQ